MGEVYRARDPRLGREVAIKVLSASFTNRDRVARFEQEARAAGALNHPNIVVVYDVGEHEGLPYVVTELLEGETLRARLRRGPLPPRKAVDFGIQAAQGLAAAHEKGIVHRDLKPENLFLTADGRVKIFDFGLAKLAPSTLADDGQSSAPTVPGDLPATEPGTVLGTVGYMAPEQVRGRPADRRVDIFALGAVLDEMLAGQHAFAGESSADIMSAILREDPPPLRESDRLPAALAHIVQHCLEKDPEERFQSARDLVFDLRQVQWQWAPSDASSPRPALPVRRWRLWWLLPGLAVVAAAALAARHFLRSEAQTSFVPLTFSRGTVLSARFSPDGKSVFHSAAWEGRESEVFESRPGSPESRALGAPGARLLAVSSQGELALCLRSRYAGGHRFVGTLARIPAAGGAPREVLDEVEAADWSPDGGELAIVRSSGAGGRSRLEYPIGTLLHETDGAIRDPRVSPDGSQVAFFDDPDGLRSSGVVTVVDRSGRRRALTPSWGNAHGLAWSAGGSEIWFAAGGSGENRAILSVSLSGRVRVVTRVPGSLTLHDAYTGGQVLLSLEDERHGIRALAPGRAEETELSLFDESAVADLSADGRRLLFGDRKGVYLRTTDGGPAIRLGDGFADALSPDGAWALTTAPADDKLVLLPTGAGSPRVLSHQAITSYAGASWLPDGKRILFNAREPGRGLRAFLRGIDDQAPPRPATPEGAWVLAVSPDGTLLAAVSAGQPISLYALGSGEARPVAGSQPGDRPAGWTADAQALWVFRRGAAPAPVYRLDLATGRRQLFRSLVPSDAAGVLSVNAYRSTADGSSYAYGYWRMRSRLYLVEGLR